MADVVERPPPERNDVRPEGSWIVVIGALALAAWVVIAVIVCVVRGTMQ
jgi:hypothetical protein